MSKNLELFFSNRLEILYLHLKNSLFESALPPFARRIVIVYGPAMKNWIIQRMAKDPSLRIAFGIEFIYLNQAFENVLKLTHPQVQGRFPAFFELSFAIENELVKIIHHFPTLTTEERLDWQPFIQYLKLHPTLLGIGLNLSRKVERRINSLSQHLASLFQDYGRYASEMVLKWEEKPEGWQARLWSSLFKNSLKWTYPARALQQQGIPSTPFTLHVFSISFVTASEFSFLNQLAKQVPVNYYLLSPCAVFWSDIRSDRETAYLHAYWQKKLGDSSSKVIQLEEFLRDRNPLLANFGRMGREMATQIEESDSITTMHYILPKKVQALEEDLFLSEDLFLTTEQTQLSLLHALQADLLMMRNPQGLSPFNLENEQGSIQLHVAPNQRREVQILYNNLVEILSKNLSISPEDIIVMAPQIGDYVPFIQSIFGSKDSQLDFQILDLGMQRQNEIAQGFLLLIEISEGRWDASQLLQLFEHSSFQRRHELSSSDYLMIRKWIEESGIRWGEDYWHRNDVLKRRHCPQGMADDTIVGTWDYGLSRLLLGLTTINDGNLSSSFDYLPCSMIEFSQSKLLGKWIHLLHSLRDDLSPLHDRTHMTIDDWVNFMSCLLENYFKPDFDDLHSVNRYDSLKEQFEVLRASSRFLNDVTFPFSSIKSNLFNLLQNSGSTYRENHFQSIRFCSLLPLRSIPAKILSILGLQGDAFPRTGHHSSLNLMVGEKTSNYCPSSTDNDRYLFLEALHSAEDYLLLSYQGLGKTDGKELQPSLVLEELFSYLDKYYQIDGKKVSEKCVFKHPFDSFDKRYFIQEKGLFNFSQKDFHIARRNHQSSPLPSHRFFSDFDLNDYSLRDILQTTEHELQIEIKHLLAAARNPIKFHLNRMLEIYLQTDEDRKVKIEEELVVSALDKYQLKRKALSEPLHEVLLQAEREGKLPFGLFKSVAMNHIKRDMQEIHESLQKHFISPNQLFEIQFCTNCSQPTQVDESRWLFPAIRLMSNEKKVLIVGKIFPVSTRGLIGLSKASLPEIWKIWPVFLLYSYAVKLCPEKLVPQLIFTEVSQPKVAFFDDPEPYLKKFLDYYALCLNNFSPLLPDWIPSILEGDMDGLKNKINLLFEGSFGAYQDEYLRWIFNKHHLPDLESINQFWKPQAALLLEEIVHHWCRAKKEKVSSEI